MSDLTIELAPSTSPRTAEERAALLQDPGFGQVFTDHMVTASYGRDEGWHGARLTAYEPLVLDPATSVLHYGQAIFEGLKAYSQPDGSVALFRPDQNAARFRRSARRLAMAELPEELFLESLRALVRADRDWVPTRPGESLYLRPLMIATDPFLGVRPSFTGRYLLPRRRAPGVGVVVDRVRPGRPRRHRRGQVRRQLRGLAGRPGAGGRAGLRPGGVAGRDRAPLGRGDGRDEPLLRPRRRPAGHPRAHRHPAARRDPRLDPGARPGPRPRDRGAADQHPGVGGGLRRRLDHRGLRLRHRGGRHPGRRGQARGRLVHGGRRR